MTTDRLAEQLAVVAKAMPEDGAVGGDGVDRGGLGDGIAVAAEGGGLVVGDDEEHVFLRGDGGERGERRGRAGGKGAGDASRARMPGAIGRVKFAIATPPFPVRAGRRCARIGAMAKNLVIGFLSAALVVSLIVHLLPDGPETPPSTPVAIEPVPVAPPQPVESATTRCRR